MSNKGMPTEKDIDGLHDRLEGEAENSGYHLNPDREFTRGLVRGLLINEKRYGYWACPCRLAAGDRDKDLDIICPCDYRDPDLDEYGQCYCGLYVSQEVLDGEREVGSIPERRGQKQVRKEEGSAGGFDRGLSLPYPVYRCRVCGYLCARDNPPQVCPVCKAKKDRFERFI
jgi:ferredoxin-thioredoxin reductase catalytic chain